MSEITQIIQALPITDTAFVALIGVIVAFVVFKADHKRRKQRATIEHYNIFYKETSELRNEIKNIFPKMIDPNDPRYRSDKELQRKITHLLALYERVSVGVYFDVLDIDVFMRIAGKLSIDWYDKLKPVIKSRRIKGNFEGAYISFEKLAEKMRKKYNRCLWFRCLLNNKRSWFKCLLSNRCLSINKCLLNNKCQFTSKYLWKYAP